MPELDETITPPQNPPVQETPPTQGVVQGTPAFDQQQFQTSFAGLAPQQQEAAGGIEGFTQKVSSQQQQFKGITQDAAIGNVIGTLPKMVQPKAVNGTEKAQEKVDKTMKELQVVKDRQTTFKQQQQPVSSLQIDTGGNLELQSNLAAIDAEGKQIFDMFEARKATMDDRTRSRVSSIQATFQRIADQTKIANSNRLKSLEIIGGRAGRQRYAPEIQESILSAEEKAGIQRIVEIEAQEQSAIEQAEQANDDMQFGLLMQQVASFKQSRQEKSAEIDKMFNRTMQLEDLAIKKAQDQRANLQFELSVDQFYEQVKNNDFDNALKVAQNNGYRVEVDEAGELQVLPQLTFENQIKVDQFTLEIEQFGLEKTVKMAQLDLAERGFELDTARFNQDVTEFGEKIAIEMANQRLSEQKFALDRADSGYPTAFDELGIAAPSAQIAMEVGSVLSGADETVVGENGGIRAKRGLTGWECAEYAEQLVDLGTPKNVMGNSLQEKLETVEKYGLTAERVRANGGFAIGDVLVTDGSDVSKNGSALQWGHVAVVVGQNADGQLILQEANKRNDGKITSGRTIDSNSGAIKGVLGRPNEKSVGRSGIKGKYWEQATERASQNVINRMNLEIADKTVSERLSVSEAEALGVPYGMTRGEAYGLKVTGKPTAEQSKARQFAVSADQADRDLISSGYELGNVEFDKLPNVVKSDKRQQFEQASRAFVNSVLRRESGATITDDEFKNKYKELIPQAGDRSGVLNQKAIARKNAIRSIQEAGGTSEQTDPYDPNNSVNNFSYTSNW